MREQETTGRVYQHLYILDGQKNFVGVEVNMLLKRKFSIKNESKIFPSIFWL